MVIGRLGNSWGLVCLSFESGACVFLGQGCWLVCVCVCVCACVCVFVVLVCSLDRDVGWLGNASCV